MWTPLETSPYAIMQEKFRDDPWKLLVCCVMLNLTSRRQSEPVWDTLFERWPTAESLWSDDRTSQEIIDDLTELLRPLGLQNRRALSIWRMTFDYLVLHPDVYLDRIDQLHGVGKYARDSFNMFVGGEIVDDVEDKELRRYVEWTKGTADPSGSAHG